MSRPAGESDDQRKARQRREVAAYEKAEGIVPGTASHRGDGPGGGPTGGITWEGKARMAAARFGAYGLGGLNDADQEALRRHPSALEPGEDADKLLAYLTDPSMPQTVAAAASTALEKPHTYERADARPTSIAAARRALGGSGAARARVLAAIAAEPRTDEQLQNALGIPANTQRPRRVECEDEGWVEDSGERRLTASGADAIVWRVTPAGLAELTAAGLAP